MKKNSKYFFIVSLIFFIFLFSRIILKSISADIPIAGSMPILYSNQCRQNLKVTLINAIKSAKKSIYLVMFNLTDPNILALLDKKSKENINLKIFYDSKYIPKIDLENKTFSVKSKGLMHHKILVIDQKVVFMGSCNMTISSLLMHDNLLIGLNSSMVANFLMKKSPHSSGHLKTMVGGQVVEIFLLPDVQNEAMQKVKNLISSSIKSIDIAMFTFTNTKLVDELIKAKKRNIDVRVYIDYSSYKGVSSKSIKKLKKENIKIYYSKGKELNHHKFMLIDNRHLLAGSANFTSAAFEKNYDSFIVLYNLDYTQKTFMKKLIKIINYESTFLK
ncbi:MAG: Phospholipase D [Candidatus Anoxychlamydiales bacterium]|nr:Phospholipase D [Candidatus Anoxychlamydiales bacterium]